MVNKYLIKKKYIYYIMSDNSFASINFNDPESKSIFENQSKTMCPRFKTKNENKFIDNLDINKNQDGSLLIYGDIKKAYNIDNVFVKYVAANPPTFSSNYSGSGLPFPNEDIAYQSTPNKGCVEVINDKFKINVIFPNSYYINMGSEFVPPHVKLVLVDKHNNELTEVGIVYLGEGIPFRTLTWPVQRNWNNGAMFYYNPDLPVRSQYQILLDSAYPKINKVPNNFWGTMPPH
jgi:hypothetical protein